MKKLLIISVGLVLSSSVWAAGLIGGLETRQIQVAGQTKNLLVNSSGMTLYTFDPDKRGPSTCYNSCEKAWPPMLIAESEAGAAQGVFSVAKRKDGSVQISFRGRPLYTYVGDQNPGDMDGDGLGGVWHIAID